MNDILFTCYKYIGCNHMSVQDPEVDMNGEWTSVWVLLKFRTFEVSTIPGICLHGANGKHNRKMRWKNLQIDTFISRINGCPNIDSLLSNVMSIHWIPTVQYGVLDPSDLHIVQYEKSKLISVKYHEAVCYFRGFLRKESWIATLIHYVLI